MTEVTFAKQFLTALEARPARLSSDHVVDPKSYPPQPAFILPRMPQAKRKPTTSATTTTDATTTSPDGAPPPTSASTTTTPTATITLKPTRSTLPTYTPPTPLPTTTTSIHDLKTAYAAHANLPSASKIKILFAKKPVSDVKTIAELLPSPSASSIELSVMVMGGAGAGGASNSSDAGTPAVSTPERVASPPPAPSQPEIEMGEAPPATGSAPSDAAEVLRTDEFWADLKGFLVQRLKDEGEGGRLAGVFREAFEQNKDGSA
ncbi:cell-cycle control medial ring component [Macrophomina phaseolina]|uniref:Cell-cycle control medial ring component n=1 Tax=Macrophomina phaseolina TaxID=35725 RepID=A0ABQ8GBR0_9PEZI|nr:cell-cycle control medial ring component [Macrophomina phaseolina]